MAAFSPLSKRPLMFFSRSSEKNCQDPPPRALSASPLTDSFRSGAVVPIPKLPLFRTVTTSPVTVLNKRISSPVGLYHCWLAPLPSRGAAVSPATDPEDRICPVTSSLTPGDADPPPTLPLALLSIELVGAPGLMRKGRREPPVTS